MRSQPPASPARAVLSGALSHPCVTRCPRAGNSPCGPPETVSPLSGSPTWTSAQGIARPTAAVRTSSASPRRLCGLAGAASVRPQALASSSPGLARIPRFHSLRRGTGSPPCCLVRRLDASQRAKPGWARCATNIAGTPWIGGPVFAGSSATGASLSSRGGLPVCSCLPLPRLRCRSAPRLRAGPPGAAAAGGGGRAPRGVVH